MNILLLFEKGDGVSEIVELLGTVEPQHVLNLRQACGLLNGIITNSKCTSWFWHVLLRRAAHVTGWYRLRECYGNKVPNRSSNFSKTDYRFHYGECTNPDHVKLSIDRSEMLGTRDVYKEWQAVAYRRVKRRYWSSAKEAQLRRLLSRVYALETAKRCAECLQALYGDIDMKERKRVRRVNHK